MKNHNAEERRYSNDSNVAATKKNQLYDNQKITGIGWRLICCCNNKKYVNEMPSRVNRLINKQWTQNCE